MTPALRLCPWRRSGELSVLMTVVVAVATVLSLFRPANAQCGLEANMIFKRVADPSGTPSFITAEDQTVFFTRDVALPTFIVQLQSPVGFDFSLDGQLVSATLEPALRLGGSSVEMVRGEAVFDALTVQELPGGTPPRMRITVETPDGSKTYTLWTGDFVSVASTQQQTPHSARFANAGHLTRAGRGREVPAAPATIPTFSFEILNQIGYPLQVPGARVDVDCLDCTASNTSFPSLEITTLGVTAAGRNPTLQFTVRAGAFSSVVSTGSLQIVASATQRNKFMLFDPATSFIRRENEGNTAVVGIPLPPVVIKLYTSAMQHDTSNTGLIITATTPQGTLQGAEALVVRGVATFRELAFVGVAPRSAVITFTAGTQGDLPVAGAALLSGSLSVTDTAIKAKHIAFNYASGVHADTRVNVAVDATTSQVDVPTIRVDVKDSGYSFDPTAGAFRLSISIEPPTAVTGASGNMSVPVDSGVAVFSNLRVTPAAELTPFSIVVSDADAAAAGREPIRAPVSSASLHPMRRVGSTAAAATAALQDCVDVANADRCVYRLKFASTYGSFSSHVYSEDQQLFTTVGAQIPTVVVEMHDQFGVAASFPDSVAPTLVAYTADDPSAETLLATTNGANRGTWQNGRFHFACLQFVKAPTGLVRIQFMPMLVDTSQDPPRETRLLGIVEGDPLRSGFLAVTDTPESNYGMRYVPRLSSIAYAGQRQTAVVNVALPPITIELVNSLGEFDSSDSSTQIIATTSAGSLDTAGSSEQVVNGRVTFYSLLFTALADDPVLTFTAFSANNKVGGNLLTTGPWLVSSQPIPEVKLQFSPVADSSNNVTHEFQAMEFPEADQAVVRARVFVADSANQVSGSFTERVVIRVSSEQAVLSGDIELSILPGSACSCAEFTTRLTGYNSAYTSGDILLVFKVIEGGALLRGKSLVAGPISVPGFVSSSTARCSSNVIAPAVIGEFRVSGAEFEARDIPRRIAELMGILPDRIQLDTATVEEIVRVDFETLEKWRGTKAKFSFLDPLPTSTNRKSSAALANEFTAMRPGCDAVNLGLKAVYFERDDRSCDVTGFDQSLAATEQCIASGELPECACYDRGVIAEWGQVCAEDDRVKGSLQRICQKITGCQELGVQNTCDTILPQESVSLVWLWATLGCSGGVILVVFILNLRGAFRGKKRTMLNKFDD